MSLVEYTSELPQGTNAAKDDTMRVKVNEADCIGCGSCHTICPKVFFQEGLKPSVVLLDPIPPESEPDVHRIVDEMCPFGAIVITEE